MTKPRDLAILGGGFTQSGTGAIQRTVENKLKDTVSVKDFGAVGNGVADDTAAIQAAINASTGVSFPPGNYKVGSQISVPANRALIGLGGTIVRAASPVDLVPIQLSSANNVSITGLRFSVAAGTSTAQSGGFIVADTSHFFRVENCVFDGQIPGAVGSKESLFSAVNTPSCNNLLISGCQFRYIHGNGCGANDGVGNSVNGNNVSIVNNVFYNVVDTGVGNWTNARNVSIVGNVFNRDDYSTPYNGTHIDVAGASYVTITGNEFNGNNFGVRVLSNLGYRNRGIVISSNAFANQVAGSSEAGTGVRIAHYTNGAISHEDVVSVTDNYFLIGNGAYGMDVVSTVTDTAKPLNLYVNGNTFDVEGTASAGIRFQKLTTQGAIKFTPGKNTYRVVSPGSSTALTGPMPDTLTVATFPDTAARRTGFTVTADTQLDEYYLGPGLYTLGVSFGTCTDGSVGGLLQVRDSANTPLSGDIVVSAASSNTRAIITTRNYVQQAGFYNTYFDAHPAGHSHDYRFLQIGQLL
jgi:hypothetical protein